MAGWLMRDLMVHDGWMAHLKHQLPHLPQLSQRLLVGPHRSPAAIRGLAITYGMVSHHATGISHRTERDQPPHREGSATTQKRYNTHL